MRPVLVSQSLCLMVASSTADNITDLLTAKGTTPSSCVIQEIVGSDLSTGMTGQKAINAIGLISHLLLAAARRTLLKVQAPLLLLLLIEVMVEARRCLAGMMRRLNG
jgi:hypothetical protein